MKHLITFIFICVFSITGICQSEILTWKDHFSYREVSTVTAGNNAIYAATDLGAFKVDLEDNSITRLNKTNTLSDTGISFLEGIPERDIVLIGYENGNLDVLVHDRAINLSDIKNSSILAPKRINSIFVDEDLAYLCTEFGIVVLDLVKLEIKDTYILGIDNSYLNVNDLIIYQETIYAATDLGLYTGDQNDPFLGNSANWEKVNTTPSPSGIFKNLAFFNGLIYAHIQEVTGDVIYTSPPSILTSWDSFWNENNQSLRELKATDTSLLITTKGLVTQYDQDLVITRDVEWLGPGWTDSFQSVVSPDGNGIWIANKRDGLFHVTDGQGINKLVPNGPDNSKARRIRSFFENVWVATGGVDLGYVNNFDQNGINAYINNTWSSFTKANSDLLDGGNSYGGSALDIMDVAIDPSNNNHVFASSWDEGLIEILDNEVINIYNYTNSPLVGVRPSFNNELVLIDGIKFDGNNNLWVTNSQTENGLHVLDPEGNWTTFNFAPDLSEVTNLGDIIIDKGPDRGDYIWAVLTNGRGVLVFDYNGTLTDTSDDRYRILTQEEGNGGLPSEDIYSIAEDISGEIWIGTLQGVGIFYSSECIFENEECDAQQILIEQDGNFQILLDTETITAIEIDGGNRKWIGTQTSGAYLLSADGIDQIYHFTKENSPLLSDNIQDISFNFSTGEIFFATNLGVVSFIGTATGFDGEISDLKIYPNPVREDFEGTITIEGLTYESEVKITDINGNLVHSTNSEGGRAIWDGKNGNGQRVATGVYLVFVTNQDGKETSVGKIAYIN